MGVTPLVGVQSPTYFSSPLVGVQPPTYFSSPLVGVQSPTYFPHWLVFSHQPIFPHWLVFSHQPIFLCLGKSVIPSFPSCRVFPPDRARRNPFSNGLYRVSYFTLGAYALYTMVWCVFLLYYLLNGIHREEHFFTIRHSLKPIFFIKFHSIFIYWIHNYSHCSDTLFG